MHVQGKELVADKSNFAALRKLTEITVPKLTAENYKIITTAFYYVVEKTISMNKIPIDYVMRGVTGDYDSPWTNMEDKIIDTLGKDY